MRRRLSLVAVVLLVGVAAFALTPPQEIAKSAATPIAANNRKRMVSSRKAGSPILAQPSGTCVASALGR